jgi:5-methyltetrahydrofolate--homocysteine methyltransferase
MMGTDVKTALHAAIDAGADVVGANCGTSLSLPDYVELAEQLIKVAGRTPVIVQPNAGSPRTVGGNLVYAATAQDLAAIVPQLLGLGVGIIGGCCGTTPDHLRAMAQALRGDL